MTTTRKTLVGAALALSWPFASYAGPEAVRLVQVYASRVAHIETIGVLHDVKLENDIGSGSGFLIGPRTVLTVNHNLPRESAYKSLTVNIRLRSREGDPLAVAGYVRDPERDLALITLKEPAAPGVEHCPIPVIKDATMTPIGIDLFAMGYPLNDDFTITDGILGNQSAPNGRWRTNNLTTYGYSGGPTFAENGALVGLAVSGIGAFEIGGETREVAGVNTLIPATLIAASPLMALIEKIPDSERCWRGVPDGQPVALNPQPLADPLPAALQRSVTLAVTKDDHPGWMFSDDRGYEQRIKADPGYVISSCTWTANSANKVTKEQCIVDNKGESAVFTFDLKSGPKWDRYRGWWGGQVQVQQRRKM